ncbi:bifunctional adenosylcobinamide kinase/adenosylcobinamide-phosphate guanylyltransferase [Vibrio hannami]|uniref:bifunctional adenosylcobinamide kinase/adenosylcobinamide-phosphate guanylyltransferase n=1 Tax=Vibrio hannami TaxID=2717094 RepID=UPI002410AFF7|nr:bifunctional adenosylcobinamide kinase/adenosylcobinamide-phosphate guanylyltransferase [Vibrio hannami]MDG3085162.1 bifunctional adenosylcobinamide kinase/adenosylcobinamide-phosphate guanylyltransferase [Vibrio hannami]
MSNVELILGGARSGKSSYAERVAKESGKSVIYIATSEVRDEEMAKRVELHKAQRPSEWLAVEEPFALSDALKQHSTPDNCILVDCLTLWLSNSLFGDTDKEWADAKAEFLQTLTELPGQVLLVSNEVGCGIVPMGEINRRYVDEAGWLHQAIAAQVSKVTLVTAGLPLTLKGE